MLYLVGNDPQWITYDGSTDEDVCLESRMLYGFGSSIRYVGLVGRWTSPTEYVMMMLKDSTSCGYFDSYMVVRNDFIINIGMGHNFGTDVNLQMSLSGDQCIGRIDSDRDGYWDLTTIAPVSTGTGLCGVGSSGETYTDNWCMSPVCEEAPTATPTGTPTDTPVPTPSPSPTEIPTDTPTPVPTDTPQPTMTPDCIHDGDVTMDGVLSSGDAQQVFLMALGSITPTEDEFCHADCNGDGVISSGDAQGIFFAALGIGSCEDPIPVR